MAEKKMLAIDLGASSGRGILGTLENGKLFLQEIHRFPNGPLEKDGSFYWDYPALLNELKNGLRKALDAAPDIDGIAIDTWGVDYVLMKGDQEVLPCYAYRDSRTEPVIPRVHEQVPFDLL